MATRPPRVAATAVLEHSSPGRMRIRLHKPHRNPETYRRLQSHLQKQPSVQSVEVNQRSGSLLIRASDAEAARIALGQVLDLVQSLAGDGKLEPDVTFLVEAVRNADERIRIATQGKLSLKWLIPATFVSVGVRQLLREGLTLGTVPWYVLIYYGVDSFLKLYPDHAPRPTVAAVQEFPRGQ